MASGFKIRRLTAGLVLMAGLVAAGLLALPAAAQQRRDATAQPKKDEINITAPHAILLDAENGAVLFERDPDTLLFPASTAKLMTVEYVFNEIKQGRLNLSDEFPVSENAWRKGGAPSGTSTMFAALHSRISVQDLLRGAIIQSGNDACIVLAEGIAGSEDEFAAKITQRAREIGLKQSVFANSNGLPNPNTKVTSRELAMLARHIIVTYPEFYKIFGETEFTWNKIRQQNRNPLLPLGVGADGLKTGFTKEAGYGLVGSAVQNGLRLVVAVNGLKSAKERAEESKKLLEWGFKTFEQRTLFAEGQIIGAAKVYGGASSRVQLQATGPVKVMMPKAGGDKLIARIAYTGPVPAPITAGQPIGAIKVWRNDKLVLTQPLKATESIEKGSLPQRAFDAVTELVITLFRSGAERL